MRWLAPLLLVVPIGCAASPPDDPPAHRVDAAPEPAGGVCEAPVEIAAESTGEACDDSVVGEGCRALCLAASAAGCAVVVPACIAGDGVTVGGVTIPCVIAVVAACSGLAACYAVCPS